MEQVLFLHGHENPCKWYRLHRLQHVATAFGIVLGLATLYFSTGERRKELVAVVETLFNLLACKVGETKMDPQLITQWFISTLLMVSEMIK
jgi:hypothetical protein